MNIQIVIMLNIYIYRMIFKWVVTARYENVLIIDSELRIFKMVLSFLFHLEAGDLPRKRTPCM